MKSLTGIKLIDSHSDASILLEFNFYLSARHTSRDGAATDKRKGRRYQVYVTEEHATSVVCTFRN